MDRIAHTQALPPGTKLRDYTLLEALGAGGFGITYKAKEEFTERVVAIKEYFPAGVALREHEGPGIISTGGTARDLLAWGLTRFRQEARLLVGLKHPNIVHSLSYFEANATGYLVMEFEAGQSLKELVARDGPLDEGDLLRLTQPLLAAVEEVHRHGILHRDIKPDNVLIRSDGSPILLDFGAARQSLSQHSRGLTVILSEGFGPPEQYDVDGHQGPWTDIYALGALMYFCLTGEKPAGAMARSQRWREGHDTSLRSFGRLPLTASSTIVQAIDCAMALDERARPQSIRELRVLLNSDGNLTLLLGNPSPEVADRQILDEKRVGADTSMAAPIRSSGDYRGKYRALYEHLGKLPSSQWRTTFGEVERILGFRLPASARTHRPWWANSYSGAGLSQSLAWQAAGWKTTEVDLGSERLIFVRER